MLIKLTMMVGMLVALMTGCLVVDDSTHPARGKSPAIEAFQASRRATQSDLQIDAVLDAQTATADSVSVDPAAEALRVQSVIEWTLAVYCEAWAVHAGVDWAPSSGKHTPAEAGTEAARFQAAMQTARAALPAQPWDAAWKTFEAGFLAAEAGVPAIPVEWVAERKGMLQGALDAAYIGAVKDEAPDLDAALSSLGTTGALLFTLETDEFNSLLTPQ